MLLERNACPSMLSGNFINVKHKRSDFLTNARGSPVSVNL